MRKLLYMSIAVGITLVLGSCLKDTCSKMRTYTFYQPVYKTTAEVRANIKSKPPVAIEQPGKLFVIGNYIFLNEVDKGIHVIDNHNPAAPVNISFVEIPGNMDLAVKGNMLYADLYTDLVTLNIANPLNVKVEHYNEGVFPHRSYGYGFVQDTLKIITSWIKRDTLIKDNCSQPVTWGGVYMDFANASVSPGTNASSVKSSSPVGKGGSMARFALADNYLYTVSNYDLKIFALKADMVPEFSNNINLGNWGVETIFPFKDKLFIGTNSGMFVYNILNPASPFKEGEFAHVMSCDPVIADDAYAYVTLRSGTACQGFTNQLEVLKLNNIINPSLIKTYPMTNPHGLSKDGNLLFICDGAAGLKIYNAADVEKISLLKHIKMADTYDVIADRNVAIVVAKDGLYQFDYSKPGNIRLISKIGIKN